MAIGQQQTVLLTEYRRIATLTLSFQFGACEGGRSTWSLVQPPLPHRVSKLLREGTVILHLLSAFFASLMLSLQIGVLALQGAFREHLKASTAAGASLGIDILVKEVRTADELHDLDGPHILPFSLCRHFWLTSNSSRNSTLR